MTQDNPNTAQPGSNKMPSWGRGELVDAPKFKWRNWFAMLGPGIIVGGTAIGGGEWLMGPAVTARYGGALFWLVTCSILLQVVYNLEVSRYALYCGEPIFSGKFRTLPGPGFWVCVYLILDFSTIFPYLAANAATPVAAIWLGEIPDSSNADHRSLIKGLGYAIFLLTFVPLLFGGQIYRSLKAVMTFKIFFVLGFLLLLSLFYASPGNWMEIFSGFFKFGNVPVQKAEDLNGNGVFDDGEFDWDGDGTADRIEPIFSPIIGLEGNGRAEGFDIDRDGRADHFLQISNTSGGGSFWWPDFNRDGRPDPEVRVDSDADGKPDLTIVMTTGDQPPVPVFTFLHTKGRSSPDLLFLDYDRDQIRDGDNVENIFVSLFTGKGFPTIDLGMIAFLAAFVAIAGSGGLSNTTISNYTRDHGWGMGREIGSIPSAIGGRDIKLSHVGAIFSVTDQSRKRFKRWYRHVMRDQLVVWMPACFLGIALPSMLSLAFLRRGTLADSWTAAGMTADGVRDHVAAASGMGMGQFCWYMTLLCGFLVLAPSMSSVIDAYVRRWVDIAWTALPRLRTWEPHRIRHLYYGVLVAYCLLGLFLLSLAKPVTLVLVATNLKNFALGFSCWHTLYVNHTLLPSELRPRWFVTTALCFGGCFFWLLATVTALYAFGWI